MRPRLAASTFGALAALIMAMGVAPAPPGSAWAANEDCLECHDDPFIVETSEADRRLAETFGLKSSGPMHRDQDCVTCHADLAGAEDLEDLHDEPGPAYCNGCHEEEASAHGESLHGQAIARGDELAPTCQTCHGSHDIRGRQDPTSAIAVINIPLLCGRCHHEGTEVSLTHDIPQEHILENYSLSIHGRGLFKQGLTVTAVCTSCHTAHMILPHTDERSSIHRDNVARTCAQCHGQIEQVHRKVIEGDLWMEDPASIPACVDCHSPHEIRAVFYPAGQANRDCLDCHEDESLTMQRDGTLVSLYVDSAAYDLGVHKGTACAQCHAEVSANTLERGCKTIESKVDCGTCHAEQSEEFDKSLHGKLLAAGDTDAPGCLDCHEKHMTLSKSLPSSPTFPRNIPDLCARCHREGAKAAVRIDSIGPDIVGSYEDSIHGKGLLKSGLLVTPTCADCHSAHGELPPDDPESTVHSSNVADTCGKCHYGIEETFKTSVHWPGNADTDKPLPTCENCHTSHTISRTDRDDFRLRMMAQCGHCHESESETFFDTFHGKVSRLGAAGVAKCHDCHGTHNILPPDDPESTLGRKHVVATCGKCHEGSHRRFAGYLTHSTHHDPVKFPWLYWSFWGMTTLLIGTLTFAVIHTLAWLVRLWLSREEWRHHKSLAKLGEQKFYRRFRRFQRALHITMMISFFTLALTGMALKFSYSEWAQWISWALGGFETMGVLHRMGAIALSIVIGLHLWDVRRIKKSQGKTWVQMAFGPDSILFNRNDLREVMASVRWFFGQGPRPHYGRYTYWEKFDYFAVLWGIIIIGFTGLILWFPEFFTLLLPGWSVNVATIIHSDEALLAVGFIFTIHFFNTHFRPDKFPIDPVIFTGRVPLEEFKYDKPREYEELVERGELEHFLVEPFPEGIEKGFKFFGFTALAVGLLLVGLIVYAMLLGYR